MRLPWHLHKISGTQLHFEVPLLHMRYDHAIWYLSEDDFEGMANRVCQRLLGFGVISFTKGRDGGKDGRFTGKANCFPSKEKPWEGKMIIQSKHTSNPSGLCTSGEFFSNQSSVINKEIKRLKDIKSDEGLDKYLLFTNRKYTGSADCEIIKKISIDVGIPAEDIAIIGIETLNSYLNDDKSIPKDFGLLKYTQPFDFSDEEIREIILAFKGQLTEIEDELKAKVQQIKYDFNHTATEVKNKKNHLGEEYYRNEILSRSLMDFSKIEKFLADDRNNEFKDYYFDIAAELSNQVSIQRDNFDAFEEVFLFVYKSVCDGNQKVSVP